MKYFEAVSLAEHLSGCAFNAEAHLREQPVLMLKCTIYMERL